jgi:phosphohistidine phosphatase SixA
MRLSATSINTLLICILFIFTPAISADNAYPVLTKEKIHALQQGGFILYLRHASTDKQQTDQQPVDYDNCAVQRNLSNKGKSQASLIGHAFKTWNIPIGSVYSSPYCRTKETAMIAFDKAEIKPFLAFSINMPKDKRDAATEKLRVLLFTQPPAGMNTVIVGHTGNLREATGHWPKPEGVLFIFQLDQTGQLNLVAKVKPDEWDALLNAP